MKKTPKSRFSLILLLGLLSAIGPFSIDMYLPGFPVIAADLNTSVDRVSYSLSSYFVGVCVGQMLWGPLLDRFGRKRPLYIGIVIYILASLGCAVSGSIEMLIGFRFLQALGGCVGMVAPRAVVRDVFPVWENAKIFSLLILVIGVSPIIAPTAGSFFITAFGWHSVFVVLAVISVLLLLAVIFFLPESKRPDPGFSLRPKPIVSKFWYVMKDPQFFTYTLTGAVASAGLYAYLSGSPFVFMELFGVSEKHYSWIFALIAAGLIGSSQLNNLLLKRYTSQQIIRTVLAVQVSVGLLLAIGTAAGFLNLYTTIFLIFLFLCCQGFSFYAPASRSGKGFRSEVVFSRQGYSFDNGGKNTDVLNDYIYLPQLVTFGIGRFFQLQAGAQIGVLLNSKLSGAKDSTITGLMNRIDYGFAAGVELNPVKGFLIGGRYNLGLGKLYKRYETATSGAGAYPLPFNPETTNLKNGVVQLFVGYRF